MMQPTLVTSAANTTLKRLRSLREKKYRAREQLFLAEGLRIATEALEAGWVPEILLFATGRGDHPLVHRLMQAVLDHRGQVLETTADLLSGLTGKDNPQAVVAAYRPRHLSLADVQPGARTLAAERLRDPGNLGTLLRACDATATDMLLLVDACTDPTAPEAVRASMGAFFTVPAIACTSAELLAWKSQYGAQLVGAALDPRAREYQAIRWQPPTIILLGNEQAGLPEELKTACDELAIIPMLGKADSLNVAMAGTVLLYTALAADI